MFFFLSTPEYTTTQFNTTKVRVHLRNGIAEVFDKHQDLMGKVENNRIEIETNFENKLEKFSFILQDAVFVVSTNMWAHGNVEMQVAMLPRALQVVTLAGGAFGATRIILELLHARKACPSVISADFQRAH